MNFDVEPERITKIPTSSEVARKRALEKIGLNLDWYNTRVEELRNSNGEPCCESCGQVEVKKLRGKIKDLVVDTKNKKLVCQKCADKNYRQAQRDKVNSRNDREGAESAEQWWKRNRAKLSEEDRATHEAREADIAILVVALKEHVKGEGRDLEGLPETIKEVCEEISRNGTLSTNFTLSPEWWKNEPGRKRLSGADALYFRYGYFAAIPDDIAREFLSFAERHLGIRSGRYEDYKRIPRILAALDGKEYIDSDFVVKCSTPRCSVTKMRALHEILPAQWWCPAHKAARDKQAREVASRLKNQRLNDSRADSLVTHDRWGRERD